MDLAVATLLWNLVGTSLFIGLPDGGAEEVCIETPMTSPLCLVPDNKQLVVVAWDGPPPVVRARVGSTWLCAVPWPSFVG